MPLFSAHMSRPSFFYLYSKLQVQMSNPNCRYYVVGLEKDVKQLYIMNF
jgi:hypothetical protein